MCRFGYKNYCSFSNADENYNKFKVYVLARGQLIEKDDPFLSPFVHTAESFPMDGHRRLLK